MKPHIAALAFVSAFASLLPSFASADCECSCLKPDRSVATKQSVNNATECNSACSFASDVYNAQLTPVLNCSRPPVGPNNPPFNLALECSDGPAPADAIPGRKVYLDNDRDKNNHMGLSCLMVPAGQSVSKVWCHMVNARDTPHEYWCHYPTRPGEQSENLCNLWGDAKAWPDNFMAPYVVATDGTAAICVHAVNWSRWMPRTFQIFGK